jgi:electron transport complex protein RnfB
MGNETTILTSILVLGGIGFACGTMLMVASKFFHSSVDPRVEELIRMMPGANCGACSFAGCAQFAKNVIEGHTRASGCRVLNEDKMKQVAAFLGQEAGDVEHVVAVLRCQGGRQEVNRTSEYQGIQSCRAAAVSFGGDKACPYSCLGYGDCIQVCPFGAISLGENGLIRIDREKCTGCGICTGECPKGMLALVPKTCRVHVACVSKDRGKRVTQVCKKGCIACKRCEKACPVHAITVENNLARIDDSLCTNCGACVEACPTGSLVQIGEAAETEKSN